MRKRQLERFGPLLVLATGIVVAISLALLQNATAGPDDGLKHYEPLDALAWWSIGSTNVVAVGWAAVRSSHVSGLGVAAIFFGLFWLAIGGALAADAAHAAFGAGVEPVSRCYGGMDCISAPEPSAPLLGSGGIAVCFVLFTTPLVFVGLVLESRRQPGDVAAT